MSWQVSIKKHALKQLLKLPVHVAETTRFLVREMERAGPLRHNWKNFGKLKGSQDLYHFDISP